MFARVVGAAHFSPDLHCMLRFAFPHSLQVVGDIEEQARFSLAQAVDTPDLFKHVGYQIFNRVSNALR